LCLRDGCLWLTDPKAAALLPGLARTRLLRFCGGRERIETGWWDAHPVARDYFSARAASGERFWVYRCLRETGGAADRGRGDTGHARWYLHGAFGL